MIIKKNIMLNKFFFQKIIFTIFFLLFSFSGFCIQDLTGKQFLCAKILWGFEFISPDKVNVIKTDINNKTNIKEYYYETDIDLPYINLFLDKDDKREVFFSIHNQTLRVDVWTMTSGGNTTREIIPEGFCQITKVDDVFNYIENLK